MIRKSIRDLFFDERGAARGIDPDVEAIMGRGISPGVEAIFRGGDVEDQVVCEVALRRLAGQDARIHITCTKGRCTCHIHVNP
jgi:hypothetical protein